MQDVPEPTALAEAESAARGIEGALVSGVALTFYTCVGDSTGRYCGAMASGQIVLRGAAACGHAWETGTRFRILGDPYLDMVYTCLDRGGGPNLWVDVWFYDATEGRIWRNHLPQYVTVEVMR